MNLSGCIQDGLSSGEGLIHHVRDQVIKEMPVKKKGKSRAIRKKSSITAQPKSEHLLLSPNSRGYCAL
jgi:hypothetical protein